MSLPLRATPDPPPRRLKEMDPAQVAVILAADPRLIVPVGACEQHGPHLPMGTASIIAECLADDLSSSTGVIRAPTIEYGVNLRSAREFPGNGSMRKKTLHRMLNDLLASWEASGIREFILLTANDDDTNLEALDTVITQSARVRVVDIYAVDVSDLLEGQSTHLHGGEADTSLMLYLAPHLVNMERARDFMLPNAERRYRRGRLRVPKASPGSIGRPTLATPAKGEAIYDRIRQRICERIFLHPVSIA